MSFHLPGLGPALIGLPPTLCAKLDAPIVLAHGLFGFDRIGLGRLTIADYFRGLPDLLRASGNRVLVTRVPPTASIATRAEVLGRLIREAFGGRPVHLIGHSMGGLDARALLASEGRDGLVRSLTTIGTPHLGSAHADLAKVGFERVYKILEAIGVDHAAFVDLTRESARAFHEGNPPPAGVPCFSIAGNPTAGDVCLPLRRLYELLGEHEGPNDGMVSVESASAFGEPLPAWSVDHFRQTNWLAPKGPSVLGLYLDLIANLAGQGFEAT